MELDALLSLLRLNQVSQYIDKKAGLEISFNQSPKPAESLAQSPAQTFTLPDPPNTPPDLRADDLFAEDKVLNWSSPDQADEMGMPLTGEMGPSER